MRLQNCTLIPVSQHLGKLEDHVFRDLSTKGMEIESFRRAGLPAADANFEASPNRPLRLVREPREESRKK